MVDERAFEILCERVESAIAVLAKLSWKVKELDDGCARSWLPGVKMESGESMNKILESPLFQKERESRCNLCRPLCPTCKEILASPGYQTCTCFTCPDCGRWNTELPVHTCGKEPSIKSSLAGMSKFEFPEPRILEIPDIQQIRADREKLESEKEGDGVVRCNVCGATYNDVGLCSAFGILHGRGDADDDWLADFLSRPRSPLGFEDQESDKVSEGKKESEE